MQIVEFLNEFHISINFGRWKERNTQMIKGICVVQEWSTDIFTGKYIESTNEIGYCLSKTRTNKCSLPI